MQQSRSIKAANPAIEVDGDEGRVSSFEVTVNGTYVAWSKLAKRAFPDFGALAREIAEFAASGKVPATWTAAVKE